MTVELLAAARRILGATKRKPSQADLRRAISTAYYAAFDALARQCADQLVGSSLAKRSLPEWSRVYRALNHGKSEAALDELDPQRRAKARLGQPSSVDQRVRAFCETLEKLRVRRQQADYDPRPLQLRRADVGLLIEEAEVAVDDFRTAPADQRRALAFAGVVARR